MLREGAPAYSSSLAEGDALENATIWMKPWTYLYARAYEVRRNVDTLNRPSRIPRAASRSFQSMCVRHREIIGLLEYHEL